MTNLIRAATMLAFAAIIATPNASMAGDHHGGGHHGGDYHGHGYWGGGPYLGFGAGMLGFGLGSAWALDRYYNYDYGHRYVIDDHAERCAARYRSYDVDRDAFLGYDGHWHRCLL